MKWKSDTHTRRFLGKLTDFESKQERRREKKHLRAYLKGRKFFQDGFEDGNLPGQRIPRYFPVLEKWIEK